MVLLLTSRSMLTAQAYADVLGSIAYCDLWDYFQKSVYRNAV